MQRESGQASLVTNATGRPCLAPSDAATARGPSAERETAPDLTCFLYPGWKPNIRPAPPHRPWMDETPEAFANRCLPLNIANAHGWEVLSPMTFDARWSGGQGVDDVTINLPEGAPAHLRPVSLFGQGVLTFHIMGLFRTSPGWNLWVGGSPNRDKDAIAPLSGLVEADWSPFTFTMNWRFTRPDTWIRFEEGEPICFFFPVQRGVLERMQPRFAPIDDNPHLKAEFERWSQMRDQAHAKPAAEPTPKWKERDHRGADTQGRAAIDDHRAKVRLNGFNPQVLPERCTTSPLPPPAGAPAPSDSATALALRKREWLLDLMEGHRQLSPKSGTVARYERMTSEEFLHDFYAAGRPVVLGGEMEDWPALDWTPEALARKVGPARVQFQGERNANPDFELQVEQHRREIAFDRFITMVTSQDGNGAYITASNSAANQRALAPLEADLGLLDKYLTTDGPDRNGMMWIGPAGTFTPLHHDLTNNFMAQLVGRKRVLLTPAADVSRLYNNLHVFSQIRDLEAIPDPEALPLLKDIRIYDITLEPGDILFIPIAWWHQVRALDFSVTVTYTNFRWRNDWHLTYPREAPA